MKKNQFLRWAAALLVLCLFSCAVCSVTLAKYKAEAQLRGLSARVAAFRVLVNGVDIVVPVQVGVGGSAKMTLPLYSYESVAAALAAGKLESAHDLYEDSVSEKENLIGDPHVPVNSSTAGDGTIRDVEKDQTPGFYVGSYAGEDDTVVFAPGTGGKIQFLVENLSEVPITYEVSFSDMTANGIPLEFTDKAGFTAAPPVWASTMNASNAMTGWLPAWNGIDPDTGPHTNKDQLASGAGTVYWRWKFARVSGISLPDPGTDDIPSATEYDNKDIDLGMTARTTPVKLSVDIEIRVTQID